MNRLLLLLMHPALFAAHALLPDAHIDPVVYLYVCLGSSYPVDHEPSYNERVLFLTGDVFPQGLSRIEETENSSAPGELGSRSRHTLGTVGGAWPIRHLRLRNDGNEALASMGFSKASYSHGGESACSVKMVA